MPITKCVHCCETEGHDPRCIVAVVQARRKRDEKFASRKRIQDMCRRLALAPVRTCKSLHECVFCAQPIRLGDQYRDRGLGARAHVVCFEAVNEQYR